MASNMDAEWDTMGYVIGSQYRIAVLRRLADSPATPSRVAEDIDESVSHVSRAIQELAEKQCVELLVSEDRRKGRIYGTTDEGDAMWESLTNKDLL